MKRKKNIDLFSDVDQEKVAIQFLKERGFVVFKPISISSADEVEAVNKLQAVGYTVEHPKDRLMKINPTKIRSVDDIAVYFHEMMKRHNPHRHNPKRLQDPNLRVVDHSVINSFVSWRVEEGGSVFDALSDMFLMIDILFEKAKTWQIDVRGIGILSVTSNKPFVLSLLNEVKLKKDLRLEFEVAELIRKEETLNYVGTLMEVRTQMDKVGPKIKPLSGNRRKVRIRENGEEKNG